MPAAKLNLTATPPKAARRPHTRDYHGVTLTDPYFWLKDQGYPEVTDADVLAYLKAENSYFEAAMQPLQGLVDEIFTELKDRQPAEDASVPYYKTGYWYQWRFNKDAQYRTWYRCPGQPEFMPDTSAAWDILLDETELAQGHEYFRLGALSVSPDGNRLAFSTDNDGSERYTLEVIDIDSRAALTPPISNTMGSPVWDAGSASFAYVVLNPEWRPFQVYQRLLENADSTPDELLYEEEDSGFFVGIGLSASEEYLFITSGDHVTSEAHFVSTRNFNQPLRSIAPRSPGHEYQVEHGSDGFVIRSNQRQPNFDIYQTSVEAPQRDHWQMVVSGGPDRYLTDMLVLKTKIVLAEKIAGLDQFYVMAGEDSHYIEFPEAAYNLGFGSNPNFDSNTLRLSYTSLVTPNTVMDYKFETQSLSTLKVQEIPSGYNAEEFVTTRLSAPARDGVSIPVSVVHHRSTPLDGSAPAYLYGYGAYGLSIPPAFSASRISLLERGFVFAIAHIRGGDDMGYTWYTDGKLDKRTNTFNDFVDAGRHLIAENYTSAGNIAIAGGSAGGELMGAVVNQAPELWGAVAAHVPFVDVLNTMLDDSLPLTPMEWPEWGNPIEDEEAFNYIASYSPYDQLKPGHYPAMLVTAGLNDPRVTYWEPAKYVAKLRHLKQDSNALLLKTNMGAGHGGKSGRYDSLQELAEEYAFFIDQLG